jgi:uncharacterized protein DUF4384
MEISQIFHDQGRANMTTKIILRMLFFIIVFFMISLPLFAVDELKVVEGEGQAILGEDTTMSQGKATALNNARRDALEKATGIEVRGSSVIYNNTLINDLVRTATKGIIVQEELLNDSCKITDMRFTCVAKIKATIKPLTAERKGNFSITSALVQRPDKEQAAKSPVFQNNDEIQIRITTNEDAFLQLFSVDQYGNVNKLYPNTYIKQEKAQPAEKEFIFPDNTLRDQGLRLKVKTPKGVKQSIESVLVIATKEKTALLADKSLENPTITDLMKELSELDPSLWAESTAGYEVRE